MKTPSGPASCETDPRETERALRESEENFEALLNATTDMAFLIDTNGIILAANENTARVYGVPMDVLIGSCVYDFIPTRPARKSMDQADRAARSKSYVRFQGNLKGRVYDNSIYPVFDDSGNVKRLAIYARDVTESQRIQDALRRTEEKYRNIFENATEGIFQISPRGRFVSANPSLARIHGYDSPEDLINSVTNVARLFVHDEELSHLTRLLNREGRISNFETQQYHKDGTTKWVSINARVVRDDTGKRLYYEGTMQDVTERKTAEAALAESEERYRTAIESSNDGVAIIRGDVHLYVNRRFVEMFGYSRPDEIVGKQITIVIHPDDREMVTGINMRRQKDIARLSRYEFRGMTREGKLIYIEVAATDITYRGEPVSLVYLRDITERKLAEEALKQSHLELERLNRAKTRAVNHISHELKTPLAVVQGNIRILKRKLADTPLGGSLRSNMEILDRNLERLFNISKQTDEIFRVSQELEAGVLLSDLDRLWQRMEDFPDMPPEILAQWNQVKKWISQYMSGSPLAFQSVDLYPFVRSLVDKVKQKASHRKIDYAVEGENDLYAFMAPDVLGDVLEGLLKNAIENTPDGGLIKVAVEQKDENINIHVADYGTGIAREHLQYLFDGLFDTKETDLYTSGRPYDFGAGGKGFDLLRIKMYGKRFGFDVSVQSSKCMHIPNDDDQCPGDISNCRFCRTPDDCVRSGGTVFTVSFPRDANRTSTVWPQ